MTVRGPVPDALEKGGQCFIFQEGEGEVCACLPQPAPRKCASLCKVVGLSLLEKG